MGATNKLFDESQVSGFSPLNQLSSELLEELLQVSTVERFPPGRKVFSEDDTDNRSIFLLSGQLALVTEGSAAATLKADTEEARTPIADQKPRAFTALAKSAVTVLCIETGKLNELIERNEAGGGAAANDSTDKKPAAGSGKSSSKDPVEQVLASALFSKLPNPHIQVLRNRLSQFPMKKGDIIIKEGDSCEYFHFINQGRVEVSRQLGRVGQKLMVGELGPGEGFGEGSLIANDIHDSTITALEDGLLLRLSKGEFLTLLVRPYVKWISYEKVVEMQKKGSLLMDVRSPEVYQRQHLKSSINFPLKILRTAAVLLDKSKDFIICCDAGRRSSTAAFLLAQQGMGVKILSEPIRKALEKEQGKKK